MSQHPGLGPGQHTNRHRNVWVDQIWSMGYKLLLTSEDPGIDLHVGYEQLESVREFRQYEKRSHKNGGFMLRLQPQQFLCRPAAC